MLNTGRLKMRHSSLLTLCLYTSQRLQPYYHPCSFEERCLFSINNAFFVGSWFWGPFWKKYRLTIVEYWEILFFHFYEILVSLLALYAYFRKMIWILFSIPFEAIFLPYNYSYLYNCLYTMAYFSIYPCSFIKRHWACIADILQISFHCVSLVRIVTFISLGLITYSVYRGTQGNIWIMKKWHLLMLFSSLGNMCPSKYYR